MDQYYSIEDLDEKGIELGRRFRPDPVDLSRLEGFLRGSIQNLSDDTSYVHLATKVAYELLGESVEGFLANLRENQSSYLPLLAPGSQSCVRIPAGTADLLYAADIRNELAALISRVENYLCVQAAGYACAHGEPAHIRFVNDPDCLEDAFWNGVERFIADVARPALHLLRLPQSELHECISNARYNVLAGLPLFRGESKLSSWIHRITWNACLTRRAQLRRGANRIIQSLDLRLIESLTASQELEAGDGDAREKVNNMMAVANVSVRGRKVLMEVLGEGRRSKEVGAEMGLADGSIRSIVHRELTKIREANGVVAGKKMAL
jgi:RNA polymerase sigma-70 factor (ECF subfamily)